MIARSIRSLLTFFVIINRIKQVHVKNGFKLLTKKVHHNDMTKHLQLLNFTCATAKDELEKHPEMRTIAMVELENNFPSEFSREVLKCLPADVAKVVVNPHTIYDLYGNNTIDLLKSILIIYVSDEIRMEKNPDCNCFEESLNFYDMLVTLHRSKHLILTSDSAKAFKMVTKLPNVVQIYEKNKKIISKRLAKSISFFISKRKNLSQILFPNKRWNINRARILAVWMEEHDTLHIKERNRPLNKWTYFLDIVAAKLNGTLIFKELRRNLNSDDDWFDYQRREIVRWSRHLDFFLNNYGDGWHELISYNSIPYCFMAPLPDPYSITELILFLPLDKSCWMWLGITIAVSTLVWRISEGHWNFPFGYFSYFVDQAQLVVRIRTNRLTMKILLQLLIFAMFIFSNGYQSLVTSFMLNPLQQKLLKTIDEVLDSELKIQKNEDFEDYLQENSKLQKVNDEDRFVSFDAITLKNWTDIMFEQKIAMLQHCHINKIRIEHWGDGKSWSKLYQIAEVGYFYYQDLYTRPFHPHIIIFQELMDRSFEAGLHQAWERFFFEGWIENFGKEVTTKGKEEEKKFLDFGLIAPFFLILVFGFGAAVIALLCEIFWKDFVSQLSKEYFKRKRNEFIEKRRVRRNRVEAKRTGVKMRNIEVKPRRKSI